MSHPKICDANHARTLTSMYQHQKEILRTNASVWFNGPIIEETQ
jgi:hypothetical protein